MGAKTVAQEKRWRNVDLKIRLHLKEVEVAVNKAKLEDSLTLSHLHRFLTQFHLICLQIPYFFQSLKTHPSGKHRATPVNCPFVSVPVFQ